ncbi:hypothetical protein ACFQBQ_10425 [Granulicella cerasi]|uniref:Peptidase M28 n=1 Tax=Granulicella cerasi TaxID=741063 RepID=A0ABW1Z949_9BACT
MVCLDSKFRGRRAVAALALAAMCAPVLAVAQKAEKGTEPGGYYAAQPAVENIDLNMYARIRAEGMQHGKVMQFAYALMDGIGPRLTGSPNLAKANAWTRDTMTGIGLSNAHLEDWGEFGMGWQQLNTWAQMTSPDPEPLWMQALPWSPSTNGTVDGDIFYLPLTADTNLDKFKGKLKGKIVLLGAMRTTPDLTEPLFHRYTDDELKAMTEFKASDSGPRLINGQTFEQYMAERMKAAELRKNALKMMAEEGVLAIITPSRDGGKGGGTGVIFDDNGNMLSRDGYKVEGKVTIPCAVMMIEHYNRLARMYEHHVAVHVAVNIETRFTGDHEHGFNTVAEIPGTDPG